MDNLNQETISKLKQMKIDYESPWYKASEIDNYDLKNKVIETIKYLYFKYIYLLN